MADAVPRRRLGVIVPSSNTVVEDAMRDLVPPAIALHVARFHVVNISDGAQSRSQFEPEAMMAAATSLAEAGVDHILWAGTAAAWLGEAHDQAFVDACRREFGLPATTAVTALRKRLEALKARRIGLVTPYIADLETRIIANYADQGFETVSSERLDITVNTEYAQVGADTLRSMVDRVAQGGPDAILILCTNLAGHAVAREATYRLAMPVLDSVAVSFEDALDAVGGTPRRHAPSP